jgi:adenylate kinase
MRYRTILLFGAPGVGKGTQGKNLGAMPGFFHCSCGDVFRALDPQSPIGKLFAQYSRTGGLVPDELTVQLWRETVEAWAAAGKFNPQSDILLLDGIPRSLEQATIMDPMLDVAAVVYLICNNVEEIVARLQRRAKGSGRVDDTNEEVIRHRMDVYEEVTRPVLEFYPRNKIFRVDGSRRPDEVTGEMLRVLKFIKR